MTDPHPEFNLPGSATSSDTGGSASSNTSEDSNGFVKLSHPTEPLIDFPSLGDASMEHHVDPLSRMDQKEEAGEGTFGKVTEAVSSGYEKLADAASAAVHGASDAAQSTYNKTADLAQDWYERALDTEEAARIESSEAARVAYEKLAEEARIMHDQKEAAKELVTEEAKKLIDLEESSKPAPGFGDKMKETASDAFSAVSDFGHAVLEKAHDIGETTFVALKPEHEKPKEKGHEVDLLGEFDPLKSTPKEEESLWKTGSHPEPEFKPHVKEEKHVEPEHVSHFMKEVVKPEAVHHAEAGTHFEQSKRDTEYERAEQELLKQLDEMDRDLENFENSYQEAEATEGAHHGFESTPRPPTPPKLLDDETEKPTTISVGPAHHKPSHQYPHSILKHKDESWCSLKSLDPRVLDLIYWRDPKKSGIVLALTLAALYVLASFPLISVFSYLGLALLGGTFGFRLYKTVEAQLKKTDATNPFQPYLDKPISVPQDRVHQQVDVIIEHLQHVGTELKRLFLVENMCDTVKFGLLLWALTYVGSWFSGLCLLTLLILGIFSVPKVYEVYQEPIDEKLALIKEQLKKISDMVGEKVPFLKCTKAEKHEKST